jgi:hypothetical protein
MKQTVWFGTGFINSALSETEIKIVKASQLLKQVTFSLRRMPCASGVSQTRN